MTTVPASPAPTAPEIRTCPVHGDWKRSPGKGGVKTCPGCLKGHMKSPRIMPSPAQSPVRKAGD
jgi:hypothetical protein